jgi:predicted neuraminidase
MGLTVGWPGLLFALALATVVVAAPALPAGKLEIRRVFGPEVPTGPYKHPASITELENGDLYLVYYGGEGEYAVDTGVYGARLKRGSRRWSTPQRIAHDPYRSLGNGVVWQAPRRGSEPGTGEVWLFYVVRWGDTWSTSRIQAKVSRDGARTWSDSMVVSEIEGEMVRGRPIVLENGEYLLPIYHETGHDTENVGPDSTSRFLRFNPRPSKGVPAWVPSGAIRSAKGNIQPAVVQLSAKHLIAYCRRGGGYGPVTDGYIVASESRDAGRTWSEGRDTSFPNPNAAIDLLKLENGHLLLVYNDSMTRRTPLTAAISADGGRTWPFRRMLQYGPRDYAYPYAIQAADRRLHVIYTTERRTVIQHAVFDEAWVTGAPR